MLQNRRILVIVAHPDDEVLGMGGSIAKFSSSGASVALLIITDGSSSQYRNADVTLIKEQKKIETQKSADILGISKIYYAYLPDMQLDTTPHIEINESIEKIIKLFQPTDVFTHFWGDVNRDHQRVYESTLVACRPVGDNAPARLFAYSVPSSTEWNIQIGQNIFCPTWYIDIDGDFAEKKYAAMACYATELRQYPHPRSIEYIRNADKAEGNRVGLHSAESFILLRNIER